MKKLLLAGLFLLAVPFATMAEMADVDTSGQEETPSCIELKNNMRYRMRDVNTKGEVSILQDFLNGEGFLKTAPTGFFGLSTLKAVKNFQSSIKLSPTGYVGKLTRAQIKEMTCEGAANETTTTTTIPPITTVASCTTPWGSSVANGSSVTASQFSTVSYDQTCVAETRTCSNGVLSGTYKYATCATQTVSTAPSITSFSPTVATTGINTKIRVYGKNLNTVNKASLISNTKGDNAYFVEWSPISDTELEILTPADMRLGDYAVNLCSSSGCATSSSLLWVQGATTVAPAPTVEFIGTPTLTLQYDSTGKESMLVGKATVNVTAGGTPMAFGGSVPTILVTNQKQAFTNSTKISVASSVGTQSSAASVIPTIPANTTATVAITTSVPTRELFAGSYTLLPTDLYYYLNNTSGINQLVSALSFKNVQSSNSVTIIGETAPYITSSSLSGASDQTLYVYGDRFSQTGNTVTFGGQSLVIPAAYNEKANPLSIAIIPSKFGIVATGWYTLQISTSEGASNKVNVYVTVQNSPTVTVLSPNGGEVMTVGKTYPLKWIIKNYPTEKGGLAEVVLRNANTYAETSVVSAGIDNNNESWINWTIPSSVAPGLYDIKIYVVSNAKDLIIKDVSDAPFSVVATTTTATLQSTSQLASVLDAFSRPSTQTTSAPASVSAPVWAYEWTRNLEVGSSYADDVTALQTALTKEGVYTGEVTGGFYSQTYLGVKAFQAKYGIESTGFVGPITLAKLNELY